MKCIRTVSKCIQTVYSNCILTVSQLKNIYAVYITYIYLIHICITSFKETLESFFFFWWGGRGGGSGVLGLPHFELCQNCTSFANIFAEIQYKFWNDRALSTGKEAIAMESFIDEIYDGTFTPEFSVLMLKLLKQFFFKTIEKLTLKN